MTKAMIRWLIVNANLPLATANKMTAAVKILFSFSEISFSKIPFLLHSMLMVTNIMLTLSRSLPVLNLSSFSQSCGDPSE